MSGRAVDKGGHARAPSMCSTGPALGREVDGKCAGYPAAPFARVWSRQDLHVDVSQRAPKSRVCGQVAERFGSSIIVYVFGWPAQPELTSRSWHPALWLAGLLSHVLRDNPREIVKPTVRYDGADLISQNRMICIRADTYRGSAIGSSCKTFRSASLVTCNLCQSYLLSTGHISHPSPIVCKSGTLDMRSSEFECRAVVFR